MDQSDGRENQENAAHDVLPPMTGAGLRDPAWSGGF